MDTWNPPVEGQAVCPECNERGLWRTHRGRAPAKCDACRGKDPRPLDNLIPVMSEDPAPSQEAVALHLLARRIALVASALDSDDPEAIQKVLLMEEPPSDEILQIATKGAQYAPLRSGLPTEAHAMVSKAVLIFANRLIEEAYKLPVNALPGAIRTLIQGVQNLGGFKLGYVNVQWEGTPMIEEDEGE